jgi:ribosomal protein S18 acetylase RimI-like enzyme
MTVLPNRSVQIIADRASPALVLGVKAKGCIVGVLEIFKGKDHHAEIGISVEDAFQGQGYGSALFLEGLIAAEKLGVRTADLYFSSENHGVRSLVHAVGSKVVQTGPDCESHIDIAGFKRSAARLRRQPYPKGRQGPPPKALSAAVT